MTAVAEVLILCALAQAALGWGLWFAAATPSPAIAAARRFEALAQARKCVRNGLVLSLLGIAVLAWVLIAQAASLATAP